MPNGHGYFYMPCNTNLFPALLIAHSYCWTHCISGNIVYGYFSDFILPIIILIRLVTLANNARCYFFMHSLKLLLLAGTSETLPIEQDNILGSVQV